MTSGAIKPGKYKHFKGDLVEVIGTAVHSETLENLIIYKHITGKHAEETHCWVRPLKMFSEEVEFGGEKVLRFKYIG
jgi:hypothetical protein